GLFVAVASLGCRGFPESLLAAADRETEPASRLDAMGRAYVSFAKKYPGLFTLMFRAERLDTARPALSYAMDAAGLALAQAVGAQGGGNNVRETPSRARAARSAPARAAA